MLKNAYRNFTNLLIINGRLINKCYGVLIGFESRVVSFESVSNIVESILNNSLYFEIRNRILMNL